MTHRTLAARLAAALADELAPRVPERTPGQAWGVFDGERLVRVHGEGDAARDPGGTAFRIASCTKSFTAAAALLLADDGVLDLDEPLAEALDVPLRILGDAEHGGDHGGGPAPTVRDALAMRAGFPTDDPWADRQESLDDAAFARMLGAGVRTIWPAGIRFEYSNLGYAIVGRIIGLRAGMPYRRVVETRLLEPLGLTGTGFEATATAIRGHRRGPDGWEQLPFSGPGAFSPIGGLFSTVADLTRWAGALAGSDAAGVLPDGLGERMQRPETRVVDGPAGAGEWYGLGLTIRTDPAGRRLIGHSGGYPGFAARMEWEAGSRVGAVAFENAGYTGLAIPVRAAFDAVLPPTAGEWRSPDAPGYPAWPETVAAAERVRDALAGGALPDRALLDDCVDADAPLDRRASALAELIAEIGGVEELGGLEHRTPAHAAWVMRGPRGGIRCELLMTPLAETRVQRLHLALEQPTAG
ncbi:serine hydrolase domain-containing protein [Protaetiibacter larvae]|nr:serine hydrolase domain-containing protein [Protaetiibacter larvae]